MKTGSQIAATVPHQGEKGCINVITQPKIQKQFSNLSRKVSLEALRTQRCVVFQDSGEADEWIRLKHTGQNSGIGTVDWDAQSIARFSERFGKKSVALQVIDFFKANIDLTDQETEKINKISITNISRLFNDPDVRETIGISVIDSEMRLEYPIREVLKPLRKIFNDFAFKDKKEKVKSIYYKRDRLDYLSTFQRHELPVQEAGKSDSQGNEEDSKRNNAQKTDNAKNIGSNDAKQWSRPEAENTRNRSNKKKASPDDLDPVIDKNGDEGRHTENSQRPKDKQKRSIPLSSNRKYLIPGNCPIRIRDHRANEIYKELKRLSVKDFPNSVAVLFRVFLEGSLNHFIKKYSVPQKRNLKRKTWSLADKLIDTCDFMEYKKLLSTHELAQVRTLGAEESKYDSSSVTTLHFYVHNFSLSPKPDVLKNTWNNMEKFIVMLWEAELDL